MQVPLAVLADYANVTDNKKLNIMGIFNLITAVEVPAAHNQMQLVFVLEADPTERGAKKQIQIVLMDEDGTQLVTLGTEIQVPTGGPLVQRMNQMVQLNGLVFPRFGTYSFIIKVNDDQKASVSFTVEQTKPRVLPPTT